MIGIQYSIRKVQWKMENLKLKLGQHKFSMSFFYYYYGKYDFLCP